jgi:hypothetical protein
MRRLPAKYDARAPLPACGMRGITRAAQAWRNLLRLGALLGVERTRRSAMREIRRRTLAVAATLTIALTAAEAPAQIVGPGRRIPRPNRVIVANSCRGPVKPISYGGIYYNDHSANTKVTPSTISVGGSFVINSCSMVFGGPGKQVRVALEVLNRQQGSYGVTRLRLTGVQISGNGRQLVVQGPNHPVYGNQSYRIVVVTYTNLQPDSYASPGYLTVR